jgi:hypothetical protein
MEIKVGVPRKLVQFATALELPLGESRLFAAQNSKPDIAVEFRG